MQEVLNLLISAQLLGFGFWCIYYCIQPNNDFVSQFDKVVTLITRIAGILFIIQFFVVFLKSFFSASDYEQYAYANRPFGPYWLSFWLMLLTPILCTQLLWIKTLRNMLYVRLAIGIVLIGILSFEKLIILLTSAHRDFIPSSVQKALIYETLLNYLYLLIIFMALNSITYFAVQRYFKVLRS